MSVDDCRDYTDCKSVILKANECIPEAYRQCFRLQKKEEVQTHLEFVSDLRRNFNSWCTALDIKTFEDLTYLMVLELFKNTTENILFLKTSASSVCKAGCLAASVMSK